MDDATAEFDTFADDYAGIHARNIRMSGEVPDYFARYKIEELHRRWFKFRTRPPENILDFGCGVGASLSPMVELFPGSQLTGIDVSPRSLAVAAARCLPDVALHCYGGDRIPLAPASQDLIFSACVFHHIDPEARGDLIVQLRRLLRPSGLLVIFEHNPLNPVTRYIVATCPFDENAVLVPARELAQLQQRAGFQAVGTQFTGFFPRYLAILRRFEPALGRLPIGAQYYTFAEMDGA